MSDIDAVLDRLVRDPEFRRSLQRDPRRALADFDLTTDDYRVVAERLASDPAAQGPVGAGAQRAAVFNLFARGKRDPDVDR